LQNWLSMHNTEKSVVVSTSYIFFKNLLLLYPNRYRKKFGQEMLFTFDDLYQEKLHRDGKIGILFWVVIFFDITKTAFEEHGIEMKKKGMKRYVQKTLNINKYNIIGALLLLPFFSVFFIDLAARIAQGDMIHYNRRIYAFLSHTIFYQTPVLFIWVILFPILAAILNLIPVLQNNKNKQESPFHFSFVKQNLISLSLIAIGLGFLAIIKLHDFAPCIVHGLIHIGVGRLPYIISFCKNA
jgi:hypothetical protein